MRLFIAEKPSVAKSIAGTLGKTGQGDGYITCGESTVTWCFGHMLEQADPDTYTSADVPRTGKGRKVWRVDDLPIIPDRWILIPKDDAKKQIAIIANLLKTASVVVNAGDPDREGQLLVDELLDHLGNTRPVQRFWVSAQDTVSVQRGLQSLKANADFKGWADAARGRQRADWLIGMNLSRAYTLRAQRGGSNSLLTVGRVQTPTLSLVVTRDREIETFKPVPYHTIKVEIDHQDGRFFAAWQPKEDQAGLDSEGRLVDTSVANTLITALKGRNGVIKEYRQEAKKQHQPLAFSLSDLTVLASRKYGYSAADVLSICQSLYETHKLTSYPRTDCAYLPESQHQDARLVLDAVKHVNPDWTRLIDGADIRIQSRTWNDAKVTAHHGIVPTMQKGRLADLSERETKVYELIVMAYIAQFYPLHEYLSTRVAIDIGGECCTASGKVTTRNGWLDVFNTTDDREPNAQADTDGQSLPMMKDGDGIVCVDAIRNDSKTRPPPRFTEGLLIQAMVNMHKFVTDPEHKKLLREGDGIGTEATRASIISELKRREFLELSGKHIVSTTLGRSVVDALPEVVKNPTLTALYERMLKDIERGTADLSAFITRQEKFIREQVAKANQGAVSIAGGATTGQTTIHKSNNHPKKKRF
jgi:DNA topoisomerase-3